MIPKNSLPWLYRPDHHQGTMDSKSLGHGYVASWERGILLVVRTGEHFRVQFRRKSWIDRGLWLNRYHERVPTDVCFHVYLFLTSKYEDDQPVQVLVSMSTFRISPPATRTRPSSGSRLSAFWQRSSRNSWAWAQDKSSYGWWMVINMGWVMF